MDADLSDTILNGSRDLVRQVDAEFVPKKDFSYAWSVRGGKATLRISDYLQGAPEEVLSDFGRFVILRGLGGSAEPPPSFIGFVDGDGFIASRRPVFIRRSRNLIRSDRGRTSFLPDSVDRLLDAGLLRPSDIEDSWFSWTRRDSARRLGFCATMFRVVGISSILDSPDVPTEALDYVVYHECLHLRQRYRPSGRVHDAEFRSWEHSYPGWEECEKVLRTLGTRDRSRTPEMPLRDRCAHSLLWNLAMPSAMEKRGFIFHGTDGEAELSIEQVEALAAKDDPEGVYALAMACLFGWDTEMDEVRGYRLLEHAVDLGSTDAMALMVRLYMQDEYDGIDNERAAELAITAAKDGVPDAQLYAGLAYMDGVSVPQDYREAARYLSLAANQGEQEARNALAYLYQNGLGVPKDEAKALRMYRTAARGGSVNAMFQTGVCYEFGTGTPIDLGKAREWYRKGAEAGDAFAAERLGHLCFEEDPEEGFEWFLKAALDGVSTAMGTVGFCYLNGAGTGRDIGEARKWLKLAADNGVEEARGALAALPPEARRGPSSPHPSATARARPS